MQELQSLINTSIKKMGEDGLIQKIIEDEVAKTVASIMRDALGTYSAFGNALSEQVRQAVGADLSGAGLSSYNDFVLKIVKVKLDQFYDKQAAKVIEDGMEKLLKAPPASMKLSELVETMKQHEMEKGSDDHDSECTVIVEEDGSFTWVYLDPRYGKEKYRCDYRFLVYKGEVGGLHIDGRDVSKSLFVGPHYDFERFLFQLHVNKTSFEVDEFDTYYDEA